MSINQIAQMSAIVKYTLLFMAIYWVSRHWYSHNNAFRFHYWKYPFETFNCCCSFKLSAIKTVIPAR